MRVEMTASDTRISTTVNPLRDRMVSLAEKFAESKVSLSPQPECAYGCQREYDCQAVAPKYAPVTALYSLTRQ